ncbi:prokaryotic phospholipase A2 domain-containing protein [Trichoderma austrokoningii]
MKLASVVFSLLPAALALPASDGALGRRQTSLSAITDKLLFSTTLPDFITRRNAKNPPTLDWSSDGCTDSPDNPFGFPFVPACNRHDFGYQNYRLQSRFTESGKLKIDNNFKSDLYFQCQSSSVQSVCKALADVYYAAVKAFGGGDASSGKREESQEDLIKEYEEKLEIYHQAVEDAQAKGLLPILD